MKLNAAQLVQCWPGPSRPRPIVIIGAGDIVLSADQVARLDAVTAPGADAVEHGIDKFVEQS